MCMHFKNSAAVYDRFKAMRLLNRFVVISNIFVWLCLRVRMHVWKVNSLISIIVAIELQTIIHCDDANFAKIMSHTLNFIAALAELIVNTTMQNTIDTMGSNHCYDCELWILKWCSLIYLVLECIWKFIRIRKSIRKLSSETILTTCTIECIDA